MPLSEKRLFLLDMDGTLYLDDRLFDRVPDFLSHIRRIGGRYLFLTNNSSRGVEGYMEKLARMGIPSGPEDYLTSVDAAIDHLRRFCPGKSAMCSAPARSSASCGTQAFPSPTGWRTTWTSCCAASTGS